MKRWHQAEAAESLIAFRVARGWGLGGGLGGAALSPDARERIAPLMADAFGATFWWTLALLVLALGASLLPPRRKPEPVYDPDDPEGVPLPVLAGH